MEGEDFVKFCGLLRKHELYKPILFVKKLMNNYAIHISTQSFDAFWNCILFPCDTKIGSGLDLDASMVVKSVNNKIWQLSYLRFTYLGTI